jgi:trigger factor
MTRKEVDDTRVDEAVGHLRERMVTLRIVDREVRDGDLVVIDYGPLLEGGEVDAKAMSRNYPVDLSGENLLKEFHAGLPGMTVGEEKDIQVKYPDDFPEKEMAGTAKTFRVTVKEIKVRELPPLDDEFARGVGEQFTDLASLRTQIREDLVKEEEKRYLHDVEETIIDRLIEGNSFEVPDAMVQNYLSSILEEDRRRRPQFPDEEARQKEIREHFHEAAVRSIKKYFVLEAIRKQEKIELSTEETDAKIEELAQGGTGNAEEIRQYFAQPERRRSLENDLLDRKVLGFLRDTAKVKVA